MRIARWHDAVDVAAIDLFRARSFAEGDPHGAWRTLRESWPVRWFDVDAERGFWALTGYDDVCRVLRDAAAFTSERGNMLTMLGRTDVAGGKMLAVTDPPRHTELKRQIHGYFTSAATERFEPAVRVLARRVLAAAATGDGLDFAAATAFYPVAFTALVMGIAPEDWDRLKRFSYVAIADEDPEIADSDDAHALAEAHSEIFDYFIGEVACGGTGREDVTGAVVRARLADRPLSDEEKIYNLYSLLLGATVTTSQAMNAGLLAFMEEADQFAIARESGSTVALVEEVLRWSSPANHFLRHATQDVRFGDVLIRAGDPVTVWLGSANRDDRVFADPFRFDVRREPNRHIAFGVGGHRCLGAPMARLALLVFFDEMLRHVRAIELTGPVEHLASNFIAGIKRLPVRLEMAPESRREFAGLVPLSGGSASSVGGWR